MTSNLPILSGGGVRIWFHLWGLTDGQVDVDDKCAPTRRWFIDTASVL